MKTDQIEILLVEDDAFDAYMTKQYLTKGKVDYHLNVIPNGEEALEFLHRRGPHKEAPRPDVILLDMGLPGLDGSQVLEKIKESSDLSKIPLVILTGQDLKQDPIKRFNLHENCYLNKWVDMREFMSLIKAVEDYRAELPDSPSERA